MSASPLKAMAMATPVPDRKRIQNLLADAAISFGIDEDRLSALFWYAYSMVVARSYRRYSGPQIMKFAAAYKNLQLFVDDSIGWHPDCRRIHKQQMDAAMLAMVREDYLAWCDRKHIFDRPISFEIITADIAKPYRILPPDSARFISVVKAGLVARDDAPAFFGMTIYDIEAEVDRAIAAYEQDDAEQAALDNKINLMMKRRATGKQFTPPRLYLSGYDRFAYRHHRAA